MISSGRFGGPLRITDCRLSASPTLFWVVWLALALATAVGGADPWCQPQVLL